MTHDQVVETAKAPKDNGKSVENKQKCKGFLKELTLMLTCIKMKG